MAELTEGYWYDNQLRKYIVQFAAVFAGMQVEFGANADNPEPYLVRVPIKNASQDRVVGAIKGDNTQNKPIRLPIMSFTLANIRMAPERYKGVSTTRRQTVTPTGGVVPDDTKVIQQRMPVPYTATFELSIWASNQDQHYQIVEQILSVFNPDIQLQTSDNLFDHTRITQLELSDIRFEENVPQGADRRTIITTMSFDCTIYMSMPALEHKRFVEHLFIRYGAISQTTDINDSYAIIADLDSQGIEYDELFTTDGKKY